MNENVAAGSAAGAAIKCCHANWPPQAHLRHEGEQGTACVLCSIPLALGTQQHTSNGRVARLVLRGSGCCCAERLQGLALSPCARASAPAAQCTDGVGSWWSDAVTDHLRAGEHFIGAPSLFRQASKHLSCRTLFAHHRMLTHFMAEARPSPTCEVAALHPVLSHHCRSAAASGTSGLINTALRCRLLTAADDGGKAGVVGCLIPLCA